MPFSVKSFDVHKHRVSMVGFDEVSHSFRDFGRSESVFETTIWNVWYWTTQAVLSRNSNHCLAFQSG